MRRVRILIRQDAERGSAVIEFIVVAVCVLVPLIYIVVAIAAVQAAMFASSQAVREAGRAFSTAATASEGRAAALSAARLAFGDQGMDLPVDGLVISCPSGACLAPGSVVRVDLDWNVPLPWLPEMLESRATVPISATHRVPVDEYRSSPVGQ